MTLNFGFLKSREIPLKERWGQQGSAIKNLTSSDTAGGSETVYTVTTKKKLYITEIAIAYNRTGGSPGGYSGSTIKDNTTALFSTISDGGADSNQSFQFKTPLKFSTSLVTATNGSGTDSVTYTYSGWEE